MRRLVITNWPVVPEAKCSECAWRFHAEEQAIARLPTIGEMVDRFKLVRQKSFDSHRCEDFPKKEGK